MNISIITIPQFWQYACELIRSGSKRSASTRRVDSMISKHGVRASLWLPMNKLIFKIFMIKLTTKVKIKQYKDFWTTMPMRGFWFVVMPF